MHVIHRDFERPSGLYCSLCGRELAVGDEYWACNGWIVCPDCLPEFARQELAPCHETCGKERSL